MFRGPFRNVFVAPRNFWAGIGKINGNTVVAKIIQGKEFKRPRSRPRQVKGPGRPRSHGTI